MMMYDTIFFIIFLRTPSDLANMLHTNCDFVKMHPPFGEFTNSTHWFKKPLENRTVLNNLVMLKDQTGYNKRRCLII